MPKITKREAVERIIKDVENWLHDKKILHKDDCTRLRRENKVTTQVIVNQLERFALPMHKINKLEAYVTEEMKKAMFVSGKFGNTDDRVIKQACDHLQKLDNDDRMFLVRSLSRVCSILLLK